MQSLTALIHCSKILTPVLKSLIAFIKRFPRLKYRRHLAAFFLLCFSLIVFGISRCVSRCSCENSCENRLFGGETESSQPLDAIQQHALWVDSVLSQPHKPITVRERPSGRFVTRFRTEQIFRDSFPDANDVQLVTAQRLGIPAVADREAASRQRNHLVYVGECPYYFIDKLNYSTPYLVPRAARLLEEICHGFADSLMSRGMPLYRPVVTSVLRTQADVARLRRVNGNATEQSCHQYGTTFDICYNRFVRVIDPADTLTKDVWPGELKALLAEVICDHRLKGTCYVKYEVFQSCFHITAR